MTQDEIDARLAEIGGGDLVQSDVWKTAPADARQKKLLEKLDQANEHATEQIRGQHSPAEWRQRYDAVAGKAS